MGEWEKIKWYGNENKNGSQMKIGEAEMVEENCVSSDWKSEKVGGGTLNGSWRRFRTHQDTPLEDHGNNFRDCRHILK